MTDRYYNVALGGQLPADVAEGASDTSLFCAVRITYDATGNSKTEAVKAVLAVKAYIEAFDTWPPA